MSLRASGSDGLGATVRPDGGIGFRVWAPRSRTVEVVPEGQPERAWPLSPEGEGWFSGEVAEAGPGMLYRYRLDDGGLHPDPASRFQPQGPHGPSEVIDPTAYNSRSSNWPGVSRHGQVIYELHIGTFTPEGTWAAAIDRLPALADLGVTVIEVMPVADFSGAFGWGYDGVNLFAPTRLYGRPDDFRAFVDAAHGLGLGVILDVVHNHLGPDGNYLGRFSGSYLSSRHTTAWGSAINFDGPDSGPVRAYYLANARYWIEEFRLDGLRLDATQAIFDDGPDHILAAIGREVRDAAGGRGTLVIAENEAQTARLVRPAAEGGYGLDLLWNDDLHHSAVVALTGRAEAYYGDHHGTPQELVSGAKRGYLFQGQRNAWQKAARGAPALDLPPGRFVTYLENHDQVAHSGRGLRLHRLTDPARLRAMTAFLLLGPNTPMLFQGQEFAASAPFLFFADHEPDLAEKIRAGRAQFLAEFPSLSAPDGWPPLDDPCDPATFARCKLDWSERERHAEALALHRDLIALRRTDPVPSTGAPVDGAVLADEAFALRFFGERGSDRLLIVNLGRDWHRRSVPEPLLAPPEGGAWQLRWSSEDPRYGGGGIAPAVVDDDGWHVPGHAAVLLTAG